MTHGIVAMGHPMTVIHAAGLSPFTPGFSDFALSYTTAPTAIWRKNKLYSLPGLVSMIGRL